MFSVIFHKLYDKNKTWDKLLIIIFFCLFISDAESRRGGRIGRIAVAWWARKKRLGIVWKQSWRTIIERRMSNTWVAPKMMTSSRCIYARFGCQTTNCGRWWEIGSVIHYLFPFWRNTRSKTKCSTLSSRISTK